jgi:Cyclin-dependent kinase inhibitor 3 (CDKN3)
MLSTYQYRDEGVTVEMWRSGDALRPYFHDVRMVVHNKAMFPDLQGFNIVDREALSFVHFPIRDCGITDDERVLELSRTLVKAISEGQVIYLHCWGGHGRTGTLVCIMLHLMYSVSRDPAGCISTFDNSFLSYSFTHSIQLYCSCSSSCAAAGLSGGDVEVPASPRPEEVSCGGGQSSNTDTEGPGDPCDTQIDDSDPLPQTHAFGSVFPHWVCAALHPDGPGGSAVPTL